MKFVIFTTYGQDFIEADTFEDAASKAIKNYGSDLLAIIKITDAFL